MREKEKQHLLVMEKNTKMREKVEKRQRLGKPAVSPRFQDSVEKKRREKKTSKKENRSLILTTDSEKGENGAAPVTKGRGPAEKRLKEETFTIRRKGNHLFSGKDVKTATRPNAKRETKKGREKHKKNREKGIPSICEKGREP